MKPFLLPVAPDVEAAMQVELAAARLAGSLFSPSLGRQRKGTGHVLLASPPPCHNTSRVPSAPSASPGGSREHHSQLLAGQQAHDLAALLQRRAATRVHVNEQNQTIDLARQSERIGSVQERRRPDEYDVSALPELSNDLPHPSTSKDLTGAVNRRATREHAERL